MDIQYVEAVRTGDGVRAIVSEMLDRELSAAAAANPEYSAALDRLRELQQPVFDSLSASITQRLQSLLPDVKEVLIEQQSQGPAPTVIGRSVSVVVDDGTPTDLTFKGDGVQSLAALAMTQHYSAGRARAREFILAVEEPEAHLHPQAIHGLRDALRETSATQQVVVTTHSPLFVNRLDLSSNIIVRKNRALPAKTVVELREALGVRTADNLESAEMVLVVEGPGDEAALKALLVCRSPKLRAALRDGLFAIHTLHGGGKLNYMLSQLRDSLAVTHAFLDNDDQGKRAAEAAQREGLLTLADVTMAMCPGAKKESEFEDLVDPRIYEVRFLDEFGVKTSHSWTKSLSKGKWSRRMPHVFEASGTPWSDEIEKRAKTYVAEEIARNPERAVKENCAGLMDALVGALETKLTVRVR